MYSPFVRPQAYHLIYGRAIRARAASESAIGRLQMPLRGGSNQAPDLLNKWRDAG
jgi:hypothetical protein